MSSVPNNNGCGGGDSDKQSVNDNMTPSPIQVNLASVKMEADDEVQGGGGGGGAEDYHSPANANNNANGDVSFPLGQVKNEVFDYPNLRSAAAAANIGSNAVLDPAAAVNELALLFGSFSAEGSPGGVNLATLKNESVVEENLLNSGLGQPGGTIKNDLVDVEMSTLTMRNLENPYLENRTGGEAIASDIVARWKAKKRSVKLTEMPKILHLPCCWICFNKDIWWRCLTCLKPYHKRCAFFGEKYPNPVFDMEMKQAVEAKMGGSNLVKCTECLLAEKTMLPSLRDVPISILNVIFAHFASLVHDDFKDCMEKINDNSVEASPLRIRNTALEGMYKTLEGFIADWKLLKYQTMKRYGVHSEETEVLTSMMKYVKDEAKVLVTCWECYLRRYNPLRYGKLVQHYRNLELTCAKPHPLILVRKLPNYYETSGIYWPAKLFSVDSFGGMTFQCFDESAMRYFKRDGKTEFYFFSLENQNLESSKKKRGMSSSSKSKAATILAKATRACERYIENLRQHQGITQVVIPEGTEKRPFEGTFKTAFDLMFPNFNVAAKSMVNETEMGQLVSFSEMKIENVSEDGLSKPVAGTSASFFN